MQIQTKQPTATKRVFPLHMTPFENYMLLDDRPRYPMTFAVQFEFSGNLIQDAFANALRDALARHPLLQAVIRPVKQNKDCWVKADDTGPSINWGGLDDPIEFEQSEFIDLRNEVGLRIWVRHDEQRAVVTAQFHHAVCDGIGSYQFLGDLLWSYASQIGEAPGELPPLDHSDLRQRGQASFEPKNFLNDRGRIRSEWGEAAQLVFGRITPLQTVSQSKIASPACYPGIQSYVFDKSDYRKIRLAGQRSGQMSNDLLLEKLFVTLRQWNQEHRTIPWPQSLCVMMPMDLRERGGVIFPAANVVTYTLIRRRERVVRDRELLIKSLREEMVLLKRDRHHTKFMNMIVASYIYPRLMRRILVRKRCLATAIMSNTGDPTQHFHFQFPRENGRIRCGNLLLEDISGVPPIRTETRATISIFTYRRVLKICLRCDPHLLSDDDTGKMLEMYVSNIRREIES